MYPARDLNFVRRPYVYWVKQGQIVPTTEAIGVIHKKGILAKGENT